MTCTLLLIMDNKGGGGGNRRHGRGRKRNNNSGKNRSNANKGLKKPTVPPPPQTKLAFRNIGNPEAFGSTKLILHQLVQQIIDANNDATTASYTIQMDTSASRYLIQEEELALKYQEEQKKAIEEPTPEEGDEGEEGVQYECVKVEVLEEETDDEEEG